MHQVRFNIFGHLENWDNCNIIRWMINIEMCIEKQSQQQANITKFDILIGKLGAHFVGISKNYDFISCNINGIWWKT